MMTDFAALGLSAPILRALKAQQFTTATDIQARAIPPLLDGRDLIGLAETGTGKTAAFLLPLMDRLLANPKKQQAGRPRALILAPTRELAQQIGQAINVLGSFSKLRTTVIFGGAPFGKQLQALRGGLDILVATPGRLMDHSRRGSVSFDRTETFILDEADRMLDMGFIPDVTAIAKALPHGHQTMLFSATMNRAIDKLASTLLNDPVRIDIAQKVAVSQSVAHCVLHVSAGNKKALLKNLLTDESTGQVIIFTKTKHGADRLSRDLARDGLKTDAIHGDRNQSQRQRTLKGFREGRVDILVATDVAARGIDVPGIDRVINFDLPREPEAYIHRVGRTGRNGMEGRALSLCAPDDIALLRGIEKLLKSVITVDAEHAYHAEPQARGSDERGGPARGKKKSGGGFRSGGNGRPNGNGKPGGNGRPGGNTKPGGKRRRPQAGRPQRAA